jgi:membrane associated rhomboid family serine protease
MADVFVPVYDNNPLRGIRFQYVTVGLIVLNFAVFLLQVAGMRMEVVASFGVVPARLLAAPLATSTAALPIGFQDLPPWATLLSYMFFHGDVVHVGTNMLFLWVFGDNVEDAMGHFRFLVFYIACGVIAGLTHAIMQPDSSVPLIGASGAVAGVIAAYVMLYPRVMVWVLAFRIIPLHITAGFAIGAWILTQLAMVLLPQSGPALPIAWWAHIGGLAAGALLVLVLRRPGIPLFA